MILFSKLLLLFDIVPNLFPFTLLVIIDRRNDFKADVGNFELVYRQVVPPTPAYMGLNLVVKGKQISNRINGHHQYGYQRKERTLQTSQIYKQRTTLALTNISQNHKPMPAFNATEYIEKCLNAEIANSPRSKSVPSLIGLTEKKPFITTQMTPDKRRKSLANIATAAVAQTSSGTKTTASPNPICDVYSTLKRHRSCGPRLNTHCGVVDCKDLQKSKFFVGCYNQQKAINSSRSLGRIKNNLLDTPTLSVSKSADNIKELCSPGKKSLTTTKSLSPMIATSKSAVISSNKLRLSVTNKLPTSTSKVDKLDNSATTMHAIGRGITSWNTKKRQILLKPSTAKALG